MREISGKYIYVIYVCPFSFAIFSFFLMLSFEEHWVSIHIKYMPPIYVYKMLGEYIHIFPVLLSFHFIELYFEEQVLFILKKFKS